MLLQADALRETDRSKGCEMESGKEPHTNLEYKLNLSVCLTLSEESRAFVPSSLTEVSLRADTMGWDPWPNSQAPSREVASAAQE